MQAPSRQYSKTKIKLTSDAVHSDRLMVCCPSCEDLGAVELIQFVTKDNGIILAVFS
jgi:hypothetical protein